METGPSVVILNAAEDEAFIGALAEELVHLDFGYSLRKKDIFCYQVTGNPNDGSRTQLTATLNLGSVKLVVPVISRHLLGGQSSLAFELETAVKNNKPQYVVWLDKNFDNFRDFGTLVWRQYPTLKEPAKRVQQDSIDRTMPGCVTSRLKAIALNLRDALCRQTGELRLQCLRALTRTGEFLADNMNLKSLLKRLEQENQLRPADVKSINVDLTPGRCFIDMLQKRRRQEPYDWLVNILEEEGQGFLVKEMEHWEQLTEQEYGIDRQQVSQCGQRSIPVGHLAQQSQDQHMETKKIKTVFIGNAMAGKTSLCHSLVRHRSFLMREVDRTMGVDIESFIISDAENYTECPIWDFAGQSVYHFTQRILLTPQALHILTVDLPGYKSEKFQEQIGTWLTSITSHVTNPAILVVGTKTDKLTDKDTESVCSSIHRDIQDAENSIRTKLREEILLCQMALDAADTGNDMPELFYGLSSDDILAKIESLENLLDGRPKSLLNVQVIPVSNRTYQGIETLRTKMAEMVKDKNLFPSVREMPTLWKKLSETIKNTGRTHLQVKDCQFFGASMGMRESDVLKALNYLHMSGEILFYSHIRGMEDLVFPDSTIIINLFKRIFRHDLPGYLDSIAKSLPEQARVQFAEDRLLFLKTGKATKSFLKNVLGNDNIPVFYSLLPLMQHFGLCFGSEIFPTELPAAQPEEVAHCWPEVVPSGEEEVSVSIVYSQEPPLGLNEIMVSRILSMKQTTCRLLTRDTVIVHTEENLVGIMYHHFPTGEEIRIRGELEKAWQWAQMVVILIDACRDEFPALYLKGSVGSKRSLTMEAVRQCQTADLLRMAMGNFKGLQPSVRTSKDAVANNFIDNRLYQVSRALGEGWIQLSQELGLNRSVLDNIPVVGPTQDAFQMMKVWRTRNEHGPLHQLLLLGKALQSIGRLDQAAVVHGIYKEYWNVLQVTPVSPGLTGGTHWSLCLPGEGKYLCTETGLGVVTPCPMHVTYTRAHIEGMSTSAGPSTSRLPIARFPWESKVESTMQPACMLEKDLRRNSLCVVFAPANLTRVFQLHVYIISNDVRIVKHLQELEKEDNYFSWDPEPCVLKLGEKYHLKVAIRNGANINDNVLTRPEEGIPFVDTFQTGMYYKKFRVNVDATENRKGQRSNLEFDFHLSTADHETVCNFFLTKGILGDSLKDVGDADDSRSGLSLHKQQKSGQGAKGHGCRKKGKRSSRDDHRGHGPLSTTDACNLEGKVGQHQQIDIQQLQQATALVQKNYPGISFVPSSNKTDEAKRRKKLQDCCDKWTVGVQHFASVVDYSLDYEEFPTITERMRSVCLLECPSGAATGILIGPRHILTTNHFLELYIEPAYRRNQNRGRYVATFHFSSTEKPSILYNPTRCISRSPAMELDYAILELCYGPPNAKPLGQFVQSLGTNNGVLIVVGHPDGQRKKVDFCPIVVVDNDLELHLNNTYGIPDDPDGVPKQEADRANYQTHVMFRGSSGSPGFDKNGNLVVMHTRGFSPYTGCPSLVEQGVLLSSIRDHVKTTLGMNQERYDEIFPPQDMDTD